MGGKSIRSFERLFFISSDKIMGFRWMLVLLVAITSTTVSSRFMEKASLSAIKQMNSDQHYLQQSHAVRSIQSEDGDIIDCIHIHKQPSLSHPSLKNHKIQLTPSYDLTMVRETRTDKKSFHEKNRGSPETVTTQLWQKSGSCPEGTIPIRKIEKNLVKDNGRKKPDFFHYKQQLNESNLEQTNHSLSILFTVGFAYLGAKADIKVWNPSVESDDEYSTSQVALKSGGRLDYEAMESGWAVNPSVYGDRQTRLFVYWTTDGSRNTGCFDVICPGFIQTSNQIALGAAIYPISNPTGLPYQITIYIHKDPNTSNWWVQYGERINIGYWPPELFPGLRYHAHTVQWGGEVYSSRVGTHPHTATEMGSGHFSDFVFETSGTMKRMRVLRTNMELQRPRFTYTYSDEYHCYDYRFLTDYVEEPEFFYGGPGRNPRCP